MPFVCICSLLDPILYALLSALPSASCVSGISRNANCHE